MKFTKCKKIIAMGLAAMTALSAMSIGAFAAEDSDPLIASIANDGKTLVEVHESDLTDDGYSFEFDGIRIGIDEPEELPNNVFSVYSVKYGQMGENALSSTTLLVGTDTYSYTFNVATGKTVQTPYKYSPAGGYSSIKYTITGDASYGSKVVGTVYASNQNPMSVNLYSGSHSVNLSGLSSSVTTYAEVNNVSYSSNATGTCTITN